jgi:ferredoxin-NADP reductase
MIQQVVPDYLEREVYISGPEPMVDAMKESLLGIKIQDDHIHQDWFPGYKEKY